MEQAWTDMQNKIFINRNGKIVLELIEPVTLETMLTTTTNQTNKVADNKLNNNTKETMENFDTNDTLLEPSESAANPRNVKKAVALTQVSVEEKKMTRRKKKETCRRIPRAKMKMKRWTKLRMTTQRKGLTDSSSIKQVDKLICT